MKILSADFGTSSVKAAVMDEQMQILQMSKRSYSYTFKDENKVEISIEDIEQAFQDALTEFSGHLKDIEAISFDCLAPSLVFMNEKGEALYPLITHLDRRSRQESQQIIEEMGKEEFLNITGTLPYAGGVTLTTVMWFKEHEPEIYNNCHTLGHLSTYLYKKFTGKWAIDRVNASITGLYQTVTSGGWSDKICEMAGIQKDKLPPIVDIGKEYGFLLEEMAEKLGLKKGILVMPGTQDCAAALRGAELCRPGDLLNISGSSEIICILTDRPEVNEKYYLRESGQEGIWQIFGITSGGFALEWFRKEFCREIEKNDFFQQYLPDLLMNHFDSGGVQFAPYLSGDRQSMENKKASFSGLTLKNDREEMLCALLEGIQKPVLQIMNQSKKALNLNTVMRVTGNMVENYAYLQMKKKQMGKDNILLVENCPLKGNVYIVKETLKREMERGEKSAEY